MTLGGRAAEAITFKKITTGTHTHIVYHMSHMTYNMPPPSIGAKDDLDKVTKMAYKQVTEFGMSRKIGHVSLPVRGSREFARTIYSDKLSRMIDEVSCTED